MQYSLRTRIDSSTEILKDMMKQRLREYPSIRFLLGLLYTCPDKWDMIYFFY